MRLRLYESAIASRFVFSRKIGDPATFDFCNTIGTKRQFAIALQLARFWGEADINWQRDNAASVANDP
jgi:hypothetical protein